MAPKAVPHRLRTDDRLKAVAAATQKDRLEHARERRALQSEHLAVRRARRAEGTIKSRLAKALKEWRAARKAMQKRLREGYSIGRLSQGVEARKQRAQELSQQRASARQSLRSALAWRRSQTSRVLQASRRREGSIRRLKVEVRAAHHRKVIQDTKRRAAAHRRELEAKQAAEHAALKAAQAAALRRMDERHTAERVLQRDHVKSHLKKLHTTQAKNVKDYSAWLLSEESRHSDQFRRCVGGSLGNSLSVLRPKRGSHQYTLVYLHQFNCEGSGYAHWKPHYFYSATRFRFNGLKIVFPNAKKLAISCHEGEKKYAWYDYKTDFDGVREDKVDMPTLRETRDRIFAIVQKEIEMLGGDASRVLLGGASQGCCTALHCALTFPRLLGGFIGVVGHLLSCTPVPSTKRRLPMHFYNGADDTIMRWSWVRKSFRRLEAAGYTNVQLHNEQGMTHDTGLKEREFIVRFLRERILLPNSRTQKA